MEATAATPATVSLHTAMATAVVVATVTHAVVTVATVATPLTIPTTPVDGEHLIICGLESVRSVFTYFQSRVFVIKLPFPVIS